MDQFAGIPHSAKIAATRIRRRLGILGIGGIVLVAVACGGNGGVNPSTFSEQAEPDQPGDVVPAAAAPKETATTVVQPTPTTALSEPTTIPEPETEPTPEPTTDPSFSDLFDDDAEKSRAARLRTIWGWETNLDEKTIPLTELETVLPRDRITPVDDPVFVSVAEAPDYMNDREPVVALIIDGEARAYPLAILMWHEIVNDTVAGVPVTVTFCPLCNTGITFNRIVDGQELTFGTSGMLRNSDLVMWDRQTQSFWQQITGEALAGDFAANETVLEQLPSSIIAWEAFADAYPDGRLLARVLDDLGNPVRPYDTPPYAGYDNVDDQPFLFRGKIDDRLVATSRVLTIDGETPVAYPFAFLEENLVVNDTIDDSEIVAFFDDGTFSAFNNLFNERQTSGSVSVFSREVDGRHITFEASERGIVDLETGSTWNYAGIAEDGELAGTQLEPVVHANHFWFAWAVFKPETVIRDSLDDLAAG
jgi:hypothetical protein